MRCCSLMARAVTPSRLNEDEVFAGIAHRAAACFGVCTWRSATGASGLSGVSAASGERAGISMVSLTSSLLVSGDGAVVVGRLPRTGVGQAGGQDRGAVQAGVGA